MTPKELLNFLANTSVGSSAVRNQGRGIIDVIRDCIKYEFDFDKFFSALTTCDASYQHYLDRFTSVMAWLPGFDEHDELNGHYVTWGTARKCINLFIRSCVYNNRFCETYGLRVNDFNTKSYMQRLEIPLDSYAVAAIKFYCNKFELNHDKKHVDHFSIISLTPERSKELQLLAHCISIKMDMCRIDLDVIFYKNDNLTDQN